MTRAEAAALLRREGAAVLALVAGTRGSAPREPGAAILVTAAETLGSIGGGRAEHETVAAARALLACGGAARTLDFALGPAFDQCCGGGLRVALAPLGASEADRLDAAPFALWPGGPVFHGPAAPRPLLLYGAGHVGRALAAALAPLPFALRWIDARAGFLADPPESVATVETPLPEAEATAAPPGAFHVVMTHSHALDLEIVAAALAARPGFVGLIGSATKRARFARALAGRGVDSAGLTCPIGLTGLRDKRPAVIAALVAAQLLERDAALAAAEGRAA